MKWPTVAKKKVSFCAFFLNTFEEHFPFYASITTADIYFKS